MVESSKDLLLISLTNYYTQKNNIHIIKDIVEGNSMLSLRLIDWYVTNYCKHNNVVFTLKKNSVDYFNVYMNYRSQLKAFKKILFYPFRRRDRIVFHYDQDNKLNTTIGQLNFFRWAIENNVLEHLNKSIHMVENDMLKRQKKIHKDESISLMSKNTNSCKNSIRKMTRYEGNTLISFS